MADRYWVDDDLDGLWNNANNWSATSGGAGGAGVPGSSDKAIFDSGNTTGCQLNASLDVAELSMIAGFSGIIDGATDNLSHAISGDVAMGGNRFDMGDGTYTVGGNFDNSGLTTFNRAGSTLILTGVGKTYTTTADQDINNITILVGATIELVTPGASQLDVQGVFTVAGELTIDTPNVAAIKAAGDLQMTGVGDITGTGQLTIGNGALISIMDGTITVATMIIRGDHISPTSQVVAGIYDSALVVVERGAGGDRVFKPDGGTYTFNGDLTIDADDVGGFRFQAVTNDPDINIAGDLVFSETGGDLRVDMGDGTWAVAGAISFLAVTTLNVNQSTVELSGAGSGTQLIDFNAKSIGHLVINDDGATKQISAAGFTSRSLTLTKGTLDLATNNPSLTVTGDVLFSDDSVSMGSGTMIIGESLTISGTVTFAKGTGGITFNGSGLNTITTSDNPLEAVCIAAAGGTVTLVGDLDCESFSLDSGTFDPDGNTVTTVDFCAWLADGIMADLSGSTWNVGGIFSANGIEAGVLDLTAATEWFLNVTGAASASWVDVSNSNASGGTEIAATDSIQPGGGNTNWDFGAAGSSNLAIITARNVHSPRLRMRRNGLVYG